MLCYLLLWTTISFLFSYFFPFTIRNEDMLIFLVNHSQNKLSLKTLIFQKGASPNLKSRRGRHPHRKPEIAIGGGGAPISIPGYAHSVRRPVTFKNYIWQLWTPAKPPEPKTVKNTMGKTLSFYLFGNKQLPLCKMTCCLSSRL